MNTWKIVWDAYYHQSTRRAYLRELWRLMGWPLRILMVLALMVFLVGFVDLLEHPRREWPWMLFLGEVVVLWIVEHVKTVGFANAYGTSEAELAPAEIENQRQHRYLMFKKTLSARHITSSHLEDLVDIVEAKEQLESHHNFRLNRFIAFVLGFLASAAIALMRSLQPEQNTWFLFLVALGSAIAVPLLWMFPSRMSRLKELRYFMALYSRTPD